MPRSYPDRPYVGIGIVVFRGDELLVVRRGKKPARPGWSIPGGAQEIGETVHEAGLRELKEETGLEAEIIGLVDVVDGITRDDDDRVEYHYTLVELAAEWRAGEAVAADDVAAVRWVRLDALDEVEMWHETRRIIRLAEAMRRHD